MPEPDAVTRAVGADDDWVPVATFVVEFRVPAASSGDGTGQTSLHHVEGDHTETWSGHATHGLGRRVERLLATATVPAQAVPDPEPPGPPLTGPEDADGSPMPGVLELRAAVAGGEQAGYRFLDADETWSVLVEWTTGDVAVPAGDWVVDALLMPVGPGAPVRLRSGPLHVPVDPVSTSYRIRLPVDPASAAHPPLDTMPLDTLLRGTATVTFRPAGSGRALLTAFADLGVLSFGRDGPRTVR